MSGLRFSGIGGLELGLQSFARPVIYCELSDACGRLLLKRQGDGALAAGDVIRDVRTLDGAALKGLNVDILVAGFPCQDISTAGKHLGFKGKRHDSCLRL